MMHFCVVPHKKIADCLNSSLQFVQFKITISNVLYLICLTQMNTYSYRLGQKSLNINFLQFIFDGCMGHHCSVLVLHVFFKFGFSSKRRWAKCAFINIDSVFALV